MAERWGYGFSEDDFVLDDSNNFGSKQEACATGELEAVKLGFDSYFVGRVEWLDFAELTDFPDDIAQIVIDCMTEEANNSWGCNAEDAFVDAVSSKDRNALEKGLLDAIKTWCGTLEKKGCFVADGVAEYTVTGFVNDNEGGAHDA